VLRETRRLGIPVGVHAEDRRLVNDLTESLMAEGRNGPLDYAASRPAAGEAAAVRDLKELCRRTGARVHIVHVGCGEALEIITGARREGLPMSGETCPHFLEFTEEDLARQGALLKTAPVVKSAADRERLWAGVVSGEIQHVATDHAAGEWPAEKRTGSIWTDYGGVPGVEHLLPYMYSEGYRRGRITLQRLVELLSEAPAEFFGIHRRKGTLAAGFDADLAVIDENAEWTVDADGMHNLNRYTPLEGRRLTGRVTSTFVRGTRVFERDPSGVETLGQAGFGRRVRRGTWLTA
jgi:dihydroorotase-like cyclic amidohydrolase